MCNVKFRHIATRANDDGTVRYYFRRRGVPLRRLPHPESVEFEQTYRMMLRESEQTYVADTERAQDGYRLYWAERMRRAANKRAGRQCFLTVQNVADMLLAQEDRCALSGIRFRYRRRNETLDPLSPSLDRKDSAREYTIDNCRVVLLAVNYGLNRWGDDTFIRICRAVAKTARA